MPEDASEEEFPATRLERGKIYARTGLKVGGNYARYLVERSVPGGSAVEQKRALNRRNAQDMYREFTRLRGTALKLAQSMSMDTGVLPEEFAEVMVQAQYSVPPMNRALVRKRVRDAFGRYPEQLFRKFEAQAFAAASLGQVHRATLKDGRAAAVKVQYPNVRETIKSDLALAKTLFKTMIRGKNLDAYFEEICERLLEETDYEQEARYITFFAEQYTHEQVVTPQAVPDLVRPHVLTMTFVEGLHLDPFLETGPSPDRINHFGQLLWDFVHEQIAANHRTIHADVHPGNFLFREDGRLGVIDFGCVKVFPQDFRDNFLLLFRAQLDRDEEAMYRLYHEVDILDRESENQAQQEAFFDFFKRFGQLIVRPYRDAVFDFGDPAFRKAINDCFKEASTFNEVTGSKHFIYVNKILVGLFAVLFRLKPRIRTAHSLDALDQAVARIEGRG